MSTLLNLSQVANPITVNWSGEVSRLYSLVIIDDKRFLYWLVVNIPGNNISSGRVVAPYLPPSDTSRNYIARIYVQRQAISLDLSNRLNFPLESFESNYNLQLWIGYPFQLNDDIVRSRERTVPFISNTNLSEQQQKWCSCVLQVASRNEEACNTERNWGPGTSCVNPYAVCSKSTGTSVRTCGENYDYTRMSDIHLRTYLELLRIPVAEPYNREQAIRAIEEYKRIGAKR